jgi:hypothetical protein
MKKYFLIFLFFIYPFICISQEFTHSGFVYDSKDNGIENIPVELYKRGKSDYLITQPEYSNFSYTGGTPVNGCDDCVTGPYNIGFTFNYFGNNYTQFYIGSNGWVGFSPGQTSGFTAQFIPNAGAPRNAILANWEDLFPATGNINFYVTDVFPNRKLIINFNSAPFFGCRTTFVTWQVVLYESSGEIRINYLNKPQCGSSSATAGLTNIDGSRVVPLGGKNATQWSITSPESYSFIPSAPEIDFSYHSTVQTNNLGRYQFLSTGLDVNNFDFELRIYSQNPISIYNNLDIQSLFDLILEKRNLSSVDYYISDLNNDQNFTTSDIWALIVIQSNYFLLQEIEPPNISFIFNNQEWNQIKNSSENLKFLIPGSQSLTIQNPIRGGQTNFWMVSIGFSNNWKISY